MSAKIIACNHTVSSFMVNGRKRFHVEENIEQGSDAKVLVMNKAIELKGSWEDVTNYFDNHFFGNTPSYYENYINKYTV